MLILFLVNDHNSEGLQAFFYQIKSWKLLCSVKKKIDCPAHDKGLGNFLDLF